MDGPRLILSSGMRTACVVLQVLPLPGVGAIIAGIRNPHTRLRSHGIAQVLLVVFGSWPLILPGAAGLVWAIWDAVRIAQRSQPPPTWSQPTPDADPQTLAPDRGLERQQRRAERQEARERKQQARAEQRAARAEAAEDDDTRYMP